VSEREELRAAIEARRELGAEYEPQIIDAFLERVEKRVEERAASKPAKREQHPDRSSSVTPLVLGSLGLSIPLIAIAGASAGALGVAMVCVAIVLVNLLATRR
jgi:anti-sigma factor RsiW